MDKVSVPSRLKGRPSQELHNPVLERTAVGPGEIHISRMTELSNVGLKEEICFLELW